MLLRGDPPKGTKDFVNKAGLLSTCQRLNRTGCGAESLFCIGAAGYPEKHPESVNMDNDINYLKYKVDKGAHFVVTQMFFDNNYYYNFVQKAREAGIDKPIIPGIIPIVNYKQIKKFSDMCGTQIPDELVQQLEPYQDNREKTYQIGVDYAIKQCRELLEAGVPGLHFYTLNKSRATVDIFSEIRK
jgi:methylenetetrahydrofolate reductase (NADPH)